VQATPTLQGGRLRQPDLTVWFDIAPEAAAARLADARTPDRFEAQPVAFFRAVVNGYAARLEAQPGRFARVNAEQSREAVWADVITQFEQRGWLTR
jgi:dTMP kinase